MPNDGSLAYNCVEDFGLQIIVVLSKIPLLRSIVDIFEHGVAVFLEFEIHY